MRDYLVDISASGEYKGLFTILQEIGVHLCLSFEIVEGLALDDSVLRLESSFRVCRNVLFK